MIVHLFSSVLRVRGEVVEGVVSLSDPTEQHSHYAWVETNTHTDGTQYHSKQYLTRGLQIVYRRASKVMERCPHRLLYKPKEIPQIHTWMTWHVCPAHGFTCEPAGLGQQEGAPGHEEEESRLQQGKVPQLSELGHVMKSQGAEQEAAQTQSTCSVEMEISNSFSGLDANNMPI